MIEREKIINIMVEYGLSPIEADRAMDSEKELREAIEGMRQTWLSDERHIEPDEELSLLQREVSELQGTVEGNESRIGGEVQSLSDRIEELKDSIDEFREHIKIRNGEMILTRTKIE